MITLGIPPKANEEFSPISMKECIRILSSKMLNGIDGNVSHPEILIVSSSYGSEKFFRF